MIHVDASFAIDLLRERSRRRPGPATAWVAAHPDEQLGASVFVWCELESGAAASSHPDRERTRVREYLGTVTGVFPDHRFAARYGELLFRMQQRGRVMGTMDLLIATTALADNVALLTANRKHFEAVPDLQLLSCR